MPEPEVSYSDDYKTIIVDGVIGGLKLGYIDAIIFSNDCNVANALKANDMSKITIKQQLMARLYFSPLQAKQFQQWITHHIEEYEKKFGAIPSLDGGNMDKWK